MALVVDPSKMADKRGFVSSVLVGLMNNLSMGQFKLWNVFLILWNVAMSIIQNA